MTSLKFFAFILVFIPIVIAIYHLTGKKYRWLVLLSASVIFYAINDGKLIVFPVIICVLTYFFGMQIQKQKDLSNEKCKHLEKEEKKNVKQAYKKKEKAFCL